MDLHGYIDRIETTRDPAALERIRADALRDKGSMTATSR